MWWASCSLLHLNLWHHQSMIILHKVCLVYQVLKQTQKQKKPLVEHAGPRLKPPAEEASGRVWRAAVARRLPITIPALGKRFAPGTSCRHGCNDSPSSQAFQPSHRFELVFPCGWDSDTTRSADVDSHSRVNGPGVRHNEKRHSISTFCQLQWPIVP